MHEKNQPASRSEGRDKLPCHEARDDAQQKLLSTHEITPSYSSLSRTTRPARAPSAARRWVFISTSEDSATGRCSSVTTTVYWEVIPLTAGEQPAGWSRQKRALMIGAIVVLNLLLLICGIALG